MCTMSYLGDSRIITKRFVTENERSALKGNCKYLLPKLFPFGRPRGGVHGNFSYSVFLGKLDKLVHTGFI